ncbi:MAG TPA: Hsp20/alpha crystallin family protein [Acidimicrobiia bacterium]|nr:Hsp20/alpha crystallin family protein [Acidimicrobiia bacterium]
MELKVWTPFFNMEKDMRTMFDKVQKAFGETTFFEFRPTTDMVRENGTLVVTTELPGIDPDKDVEITIEGDVLLIKGSKTAEKEVTDKDRYMHERHFGNFERRLLLPDGVESEMIVATYDKGVLTVKVPMPAETEEKPVKIPIKAG